LRSWRPSIPALAQQDQFGTATEAKVMLEKAVFAVKADKAKALAMFNKGEGGFKDRDLHPFCFNIGNGIVCLGFRSDQRLKPAPGIRRPPSRLHPPFVHPAGVTIKR
jgi:hypothetical protein